MRDRIKDTVAIVGGVMGAVAMIGCAVWYFAQLQQRLPSTSGKAMIDALADIDHSLTAEQKTAIDAEELCDPRAPRETAPIGCILPFFSDDIPDGYLSCDGDPIPEEYGELRRLIGPVRPDLRGVFLRGTDNRAWEGRDGQSRPKGGWDPEGTRDVGHAQVDGFRKHYHDHAHAKRDESGFLSTGTGAAILQKAGETEHSGQEETRPFNVAVNFIIKAR